MNSFETESEWKKNHEYNEFWLKMSTPIVANINDNYLKFLIWMDL